MKRTELILSSLHRCIGFLEVSPISSRFRLLIFVAFATLLSNNAQPATFVKPKNQNLANILASLELLDEQELRSGLHIKIFRTSDSGECSSGFEAKLCPKTQLLIIRSLNTEGLSQNVVWASERLLQWKLVGKVQEEEKELRSKEEEYFGVFVFELSVCRAPTPVETGKVDPRKGGWWKEVHYNVRVSHADLTATEIPSPDTGKVCQLY